MLLVVVFLLVPLWLVLCGLCGFVASQKGRSAFGWFAIAFLISPFIALLALIAVPAVAKVRPAPASPAPTIAREDAATFRTILVVLGVLSVIVTVAIAAGLHHR